jgi:hypothetical protein
MRFVAHPVTKDYVTVHSWSQILLSTILSSVGSWSIWLPTGWKFWEAFRILVTCKRDFLLFNVCGTR